MVPDGEKHWAVVFEDRAMQPCSERALVLSSLDIPHQLLHAGGTCQLVVPHDFAERAKYEIWQYETENPPPKPQAPRVEPTYHNALPGLVGYLGTIGLFAWLAGEAALGQDWLAAGRMDGDRFRGGEIWRAVTALTLHIDLKHLVANMVFGGLFGFFAGRLLGSGAAWLAIVLSAALANGANALLLETTHRSIGASTAVFAALGLVAGFVWHGRMMAQDRWPFRVGPIVGGVALLAFTGTGSENTDIGAHLMGFVCGLGTGMAMVRFAPLLSRPRLQAVSAAASIALVIGSWMLALL